MTEDDLLHDGIVKNGPDVAVAELSGALDNLVRELRALNGGVNKMGLKVNVALRLADAVLRRYPPPRTAVVTDSR